MKASLTIRLGSFEIEVQPTSLYISIPHVLDTFIDLAGPGRAAFYVARDATGIEVRIGYVDIALNRPAKPQLAAD